MEVEPVNPEYSTPSEQALPPGTPVPVEDVKNEEVVADEDLGDNVDLMA